jgi:hypothetical protein
MIARMGSDGTTQRGADGELRGHDERHVGSCSHEAFFYDGHDQFMDGMMSFVTSALAAREPVLVVLSEPKLAAIRGQLDGDSANVLFADMGEVGTNPARIIPAWQGFIDAFGGRGQRLWGIGEPVWPGRSESELAECQRHELLLNLAFPDVPFSAPTGGSCRVPNTWPRVMSPRRSTTPCPAPRRAPRPSCSMWATSRWFAQRWPTTPRSPVSRAGGARISCWQ